MGNKFGLFLPIFFLGFPHFDLAFALCEMLLGGFGAHAVEDVMQRDD
jgi:hypothetical protein